jgi:hypothetical protein
LYDGKTTSVIPWAAGGGHSPEEVVLLDCIPDDHKHHLSDLYQGEDF